MTSITTNTTNTIPATRWAKWNPDNFTFQSSFCIQNTSEQDWATSGSNIEQNFDFLVVADSHGKYNDQFFIKLYESIDWKEYLSTDDWQYNLINITSGNETNKIGSTLTVWKIYEDKFECSWIGDSTGKIWGFDKENNSNMIWKTVDNDYSNKDDIKTMEVELDEFPNFKYKETWDIQAVSSQRMLSIKSKMFNIGNDIIGHESVNMTRALGHKGLYSSLGFTTVYIPRDKDMTYKIVSGSDGFWQVMSDEDIPIICHKSNFAQTLCSTAHSRWGQDWEHDDSVGNIHINVNIPKNNWDDVAVATWSN